MHPEARAFVADCLLWRPPPDRVVDLGGRDINGTVRDLFHRAGAYVSVDLVPGPGVDIVADASVWQPRQLVDLVVCCEVLEHTPDAGPIVANAAGMLAPGGLLIVTCATDPRAPHSGVDGGVRRRDEWYHNIDPETLRTWVGLAGLTLLRCDVHTDRGDLYILGVRP